MREGVVLQQLTLARKPFSTSLGLNALREPSPLGSAARRNSVNVLMTTNPYKAVVLLMFVERKPDVDGIVRQTQCDIHVTVPQTNAKCKTQFCCSASLCFKTESV